MTAAIAPARRYVDGKPVEPAEPSPPRRPPKPNAVPCTGTCERQVRLTIFSANRGLLVDGGVVRRLGRTDVAAVLELVDRVGVA